MSAGGMLALASAVAFGATTPFVQRFGRGLGPFTTAALLYGGAALFSAIPTRARAAPLRAADAPRLAIVASLGAVVAPVALAWGLQRTSGVQASLLLNLEAVFTVLLARALWAEPIGTRAGSALVAMTAGGALLVTSGATSGPEAGWGALAVVVATFAWAADNAIGRPLADRDPRRVVFAKGAFGACASAGLAALFAEPWPARGAVLALLACGAPRLWSEPHAVPACAARDRRCADGVHLRRRSLRRGPSWPGASASGRPVRSRSGAGFLFVAGLWLHFTEGHAHEHAHGAIEHDHAHSHRDPAPRSRARRPIRAASILIRTGTMPSRTLIRTPSTCIIVIVTERRRKGRSAALPSTTTINATAIAWQRTAIRRSIAW